MRYTAYDLSIECDISLPELLSDWGGADELPDVHIRMGAISASGLSGGKQLGPFLWANRESLWLQVPNVARFLVQSGSSILIDPEPGIDEDSIRVFLLGSAFGALLIQRDVLVLHGNAIRIGDSCMVCVGDSGAGKSTLAAGFMQRGYGILSDDVVPVDGACRAVPGFPRIKLWKDVADQLQIDTAGLRRIRPNIEKFNYPLGDHFVRESLPIRWVYVLCGDNLEGIRMQGIVGMQRFLPLRNNTYRMRYLHAMALNAEHMQLCGKLAGRIRLANVYRPRTGFELDALIDNLLADMADHR